MPRTHTPCPPHRPRHRSTPQSAPLQPASHAHTPPPAAAITAASNAAVGCCADGAAAAAAACSSSWRSAAPRSAGIAPWAGADWAAATSAAAVPLAPFSASAFATAFAAATVSAAAASCCADLAQKHGCRSYEAKAPSAPSQPEAHEPSWSSKQGVGARRGHGGGHGEIAAGGK